MTHSYQQDRALLTGLLGCEGCPGYVGLLGASRSHSRLLQRSRSHTGTSQRCRMLRARMGAGRSDLGGGGDGAQAIALAIVAEVQAWVHGKLGASRTDSRQRLSPSSLKRAALCAICTRNARWTRLDRDRCRHTRRRRLQPAWPAQTTCNSFWRDPARTRGPQSPPGRGCAPIIVVLGANHVEILAAIQLGDALPVINGQWGEGMASSIRLGVDTLDAASRKMPGACC